MDLAGQPEEEFLRRHSRAFLLGTRADGSPTGWPMIAVYREGVLEFSTYRRSQKVRDFERRPRACCLVAPTDEPEAVAVHGRCEVVDAQALPPAEPGSAPGSAPVAEGILEGAQAAMRSGKRVTLRLQPDETVFVPGWIGEDP